MHRVDATPVRSQSLSAPKQTLTASETLDVGATKTATIRSATIPLTGNTLKILFDGGDIDIRGKTITIEASDTLTLNAKSKVTMGTGDEVDIQADVIKLN
jgi:hypothetical protein